MLALDWFTLPFRLVFAAVLTSPSSCWLYDLCNCRHFLLNKDARFALLGQRCHVKQLLSSAKFESGLACQKPLLKGVLPEFAIYSTTESLIQEEAISKYKVWGVMI